MIARKSPAVTKLQTLYLHCVTTILHNLWPQLSSAKILTLKGQLVGCKLNSKHTEGNWWAFAACGAEPEDEKETWIS